MQKSLAVFLAILALGIAAVGQASGHNGGSGGGISNGVNAQPYFATGASSGSSDPTQQQSTIFDPVGTDADRCLAILKTWRNWASASNANGLYGPVDATGELVNATGTGKTIQCGSSMYAVPTGINSAGGVAGSDPQTAQVTKLPAAMFDVTAHQQVLSGRTYTKGVVQANKIGANEFGSGLIADPTLTFGSGINTSGAAIACDGTNAGYCPGLKTIGMHPGGMLGANAITNLSPSAVGEDAETFDCNSVNGCIPMTMGTCGDRVFFGNDSDGDIAFKNFLGVGYAIGFGTSHCNSSGGFPKGYFLLNTAAIVQAAISTSAWTIVQSTTNPAAYYFVITYTGSPGTAPQPGATMVSYRSLGAGTTYTLCSGASGTNPCFLTIAGVSTSGSSNIGDFLDLNGGNTTGMFTATQQFAVRAPSTVSATDTCSSGCAVTSGIQWLTDGAQWNLITGNLVDSNYSNSASSRESTATGTVAVSGTTATFTIGSGSLGAGFEINDFINMSGCGGTGNTAGAGTNITAPILVGSFSTTTFTYTVANGTNNGTGTCTATSIPGGVGHDVSGQLGSTMNGHDEVYAIGRAYGLDQTTSSFSLDGEECAFTWACVYISANYPATSLNLRHIQAGCGIGNQYSVYDAANSNFLTCKNNPIVVEYSLDGGGKPVVIANNCSEVTTGECHTASNISTTGNLTAAVVNATTGFQVGGAQGINGQQYVSTGTATAISSPTISTRTVTASPVSHDLILCDSATPATGIQDRMNVVEYISTGAGTADIPSPGSTGCGSGFAVKVDNQSGAVTVGRHTGDSTTTLDIYDGIAFSGAQTSVVIQPGGACTFHANSSTNYKVECLAGSLATGTRSSSTFLTGADTFATAGGSGTLSPNNLLVQDEFIMGSTSNIGQLNWNSRGSGSTTSTNGVWPHLGLVSLNTAAITNDIQTIEMDSALALGTLTNNSPWTSEFIFKLSSTTSETIEIGLTDGQAVLPDTVNFLGVRFIAGTDTNYTFETCAAGTPTTSSANSVAADTNYHDVIVKSTITGEITFTIDGGSTTCFTAAASGGCSGATTVVNSAHLPSTSINLGPMFAINPASNAAKSLLVDFWGFSATVTR